MVGNILYVPICAAFLKIYASAICITDSVPCFAAILASAALISTSTGDWPLLIVTLADYLPSSFPRPPAVPSTSFGLALSPPLHGASCAGGCPRAVLLPRPGPLELVVYRVFCRDNEPVANPAVALLQPFPDPRL